MGITEVVETGDGAEAENEERRSRKTKMEGLVVAFEELDINEVK